MKILPVRPHKRARFLMIIGLLMVAVGFILLCLVTNICLKTDTVISISCLKILCIINIGFLMSGGVIFLCGLLIWMRIRFG